MNERKIDWTTPAHFTRKELEEFRAKVTPEYIEKHGPPESPVIIMRGLLATIDKVLDEHVAILESVLEDLKKVTT